MLYIIDADGKELVWYVGQNLAGYTSPHRVTELQADGNELEHIRNMFPHLTPVGVRVAQWYGDIAKTIFINLNNASS